MVRYLPSAYKYAIIVSPFEVPEELKRLDRIVLSLLALPGYGTLAKFDPDLGFSEWFPRIPFTED